MKAHFMKMINYDQYANRLMLKSILETNAPKKPVQLMAHLLAAANLAKPLYRIAYHQRSFMARLASGNF